MTRTNLVYSVNQKSPLKEVLPTLLIQGCSTITRTYVVSTEIDFVTLTQILIEVPFISVDSLINEFSLFTEDIDQALRETTHEYTVLVDVSDG